MFREPLDMEAGRSAVHARFNPVQIHPRVVMVHRHRPELRVCVVEGRAAAGALHQVHDSLEGNGARAGGLVRYDAMAVAFELGVEFDAEEGEVQSPVRDDEAAATVVG